METDEIKKKRIERMKHYKCGNCRKTIEYEFLVLNREKAKREYSSARVRMRPQLPFEYWRFRCPHCNIEHTFDESPDWRKRPNPFILMGRHKRRR